MSKEFATTPEVLFSYGMVIISMMFVMLIHYIYHKLFVFPVGKKRSIRAVVFFLVLSVPTIIIAVNNANDKLLVAIFCVVTTVVVSMILLTARFQFAITNSQIEYRNLLRATKEHVIEYPLTTTGIECLGFVQFFRGNLEKLQERWKTLYLQLSETKKGYDILECGNGITVGWDTTSRKQSQNVIFYQVLGNILSKVNVKKVIDSEVRGGPKTIVIDGEIELGNGKTPLTFVTILDRKRKPSSHINVNLVGLISGGYILNPNFKNQKLQEWQREKIYRREFTETFLLSEPNAYCTLRGKIEEVESFKNTYTEEELWKMVINVQGLRFELLGNKVSVVGTPKEGSFIEAGIDLRGNL